MNCNVQFYPSLSFIYELQLARLELKAFDMSAEIDSSLYGSQFESENANIINEIISRSAYISSINTQNTNYDAIQNQNVTRSQNMYLTHWMYPYKAKFHPQMARALLNIIKVKQGDTVLDPFMGSGTTAVECQLLGINAAGIDASPLCILQSNVKVNAYKKLDIISSLLDQAKLSIDKDPIAHGYSDTMLTIFDIKKEKKYKDFLRDVKKEHGMRVYSFFRLAELIAVSDHERRKKDYAKSFVKNIELMHTSITMQAEIMKKYDIPETKSAIVKGDARKLEYESESMDGIITSPPYSLAINYIENDRHSLEYMGIKIDTALKERYIGVGEWSDDAIASYNTDIEKALKEMHRVLKSEKYCAIIIGDATWKGKKVESTKFIKDCAKKIGFTLIHEIPKIIFGRFNNMNYEYILIFQKID